MITTNEKDSPLMLTFPAPHSSCSVTNLPRCPLPHQFVPRGALGATGQSWRSLQLGLLCPSESWRRLLYSRQSRGPLMCPRQPRRAIDTEPTHWRSLHLGSCWRIERNPPGKLVSICFNHHTMILIRCRKLCNLYCEKDVGGVCPKDLLFGSCEYMHSES